MANHWCKAVYEAKAAELLLYGRALGLRHAQAEDVLQETFVALLEIEEAPSKPEHYCIRAFRNRALNHKRSLWRRIAREFESLRWFEKEEVQSAEEEEAMKCLTTLPSEQREVIVLKIWHQYTFEEIGELLDASPNTVAGRYRYGLQKLRTCLVGAKREEESEPRQSRVWAANWEPAAQVTGE
jgi:RNA polymerase sigma-70 factor (ECF subfamily)